MSGVTTIVRGAASRLSEPRRIIARTDEEWRALWAIHAGPDSEAPAVDLSRMVVAAAFAGEKPSAGHTIEITAQAAAPADRSAAAHADPAEAVRLVVEERGPARDMVAAAVLTSPFHIVALPRGAGDVSWAEEDGRKPAAGITSGRSVPSATPQPPSSTGLAPRTASALAYLAGPFSGALILFTESTNQDVRFHAWQSIVGLGGLGLAVVAAYVLAVVALFVSAAAVSLMVGAATVIWIVLAMVWAICLWKAWSGERWKLPIAGDFAERHAAASRPSA